MGNLISKPIVIVGSAGKMSKMLQTILDSTKSPYKLFSPRALDEKSVSDFTGALGVIDFSLPEISLGLCEKAGQAKVPYICGTTGWTSAEKRESIFKSEAKKIPIVLDSNFSMGVELMCQMAEMMARNLEEDFSILDIHHAQKRDAPSGTALKISERIKNVKPRLSVNIQSIREGEVPGEHRLTVSFQDQSLSIQHNALSRKPFAEGAIYALEWARKQKPGLYSMKDVLK